MYWRKCGHCEHCIHDGVEDCLVCEIKKEPVKMSDESCVYFKEDDPNL